MQAIILAAGIGNRMRPLTDNTHKTLLKIGSETIIERIINGLCENNIFDITVVTGYRSEELVNFLKNRYNNVNFQFIHNEKYTETNNIFSMSLAFEKMTISRDIILIESDLIYEPKVIEKIIKSPHRNVAMVDKYKRGMDGTVVKLVGDVITNVIPTHLQGKNFDFSNKYKTLNIYKFSKEFCNNEFKKMLTYYAKTFDNNCYYELILGILIYMQREVIYAEILGNEKWAEVDDPNDLRIAEFIFCPKKRLEILENSFGGYWSHKILDFCFIRNMYFPNFSILSEIKNSLPALLHNYGSKQCILSEKLSYFLGYKKERLHVLNGASQAYPVIQKYFEDKKVLIPSPTFGEYTRIFKNVLTYTDEVGFDLDEIRSKSKNADLIVLVNSNNPTGSQLPSDWIYDFAKTNPNKTFIVDESFIEFSKYKSIITRLEFEELENIIIIKSLSKSLGVPGVRLGYAYSCNKDFNEYLSQSIPIWNSNSVAEFMLEIMLKHKKSLENSYTQTIEDRESFIENLKKLDFIDKVYESGANFVLVKLKTDSKEIVNTLLSEDLIYVKDISNKFDDGKSYLRLAVRLPEENEYLVTSLKKYANSSSINTLN